MWCGSNACPTFHTEGNVKNYHVMYDIVALQQLPYSGDSGKHLSS